MPMVVVRDWRDDDEYYDDNDGWGGDRGRGPEVKFLKAVQGKVAVVAVG